MFFIQSFSPQSEIRNSQFPLLDSTEQGDYYAVMKLRIGHLSTFYHTAILLMARKDLTAAIEADLEWNLMGTGPAIMKAFGKDELDLAYIGLPPAIIAMEHGAEVICVAGGHMEGTVMAGKSVWQGDPELTDIGAVIRQFAGRKIGVPGNGSIHDVILKDCIERFAPGLGITIVNYPWADLVTEAVVRDEVAAAFGTPALGVAIKRYADGRILIPPDRLWPNNPSYGIVVRRKFLHEQRSLVLQFLAAHEAAEAILRSDPTGAAQDIAGLTGVIDAQFVLETLQVSPKYCAALSRGYVTSTMDFMRALLRLGYIRKELPEEKIFDRSLINEVHPGPDHYHSG
jgi:NitT/TauT family transport system substrate-binding protein